jgi:GcrA cell cycle regulator
MVGKVKKWHPDKVKLLRLMWSQNRTCAYIASQMFPDCTEQAVKLKAYYLGLPARVLDHGPWTAEVEAYLRARWSEGWSAGKIQTGMLETFGAKVTRSAVIGKAHRIGCGRHPNSRPDGMSAVRKLQRKQQRNVSPPGNSLSKPRGSSLAAFPASPLPDTPPASSFASPVKFEGLEPGLCRFPFDKGGELHFCGNRAIPGGSWCPSCHSRVFLPQATLRRRKEWTDETQQKIRELQRLIAE